MRCMEPLKEQNKLCLCFKHCIHKHRKKKLIGLGRYRAAKRLDDQNVGDAEQTQKVFISICKDDDQVLEIISKDAFSIPLKLPCIMFVMHKLTFH